MLALVEISDKMTSRPHYVRSPFLKDSGFGITSVNYNPGDLMERAERLS